MSLYLCLIFIIVLGLFKHFLRVSEHEEDQSPENSPPLEFDATAHLGNMTFAIDAYIISSVDFIINS